jgi:hypothetical protein
MLGGVAAVALFGWASFRGRKADRPGQSDPPPFLDDGDRRVYFVCCDDHGDFSPVIYMRVGGGPAAFETIREAAPCMSFGDPGSAAAGLCGFLYKRFGYQGETGGTLSLDPPPRRGPDGKVDWKEFADGDVILINVDTGSARCCFGNMLGQQVHDLPLGGGKIKGP